MTMSCIGWGLDGKKLSLDKGVSIALRESIDAIFVLARVSLGAR